MHPSHSVVDLTHDRELTYCLLRHPLQFRQRVVERIELTSALWARRSLEIQVAPLRKELARRLGCKLRPATHARLYLPVSSFPQGTLVDFAISVEDQPAFLLPREENISLHNGFIDHLATQGAKDLAAQGSRHTLPRVTGDLLKLIQAVNAFPPREWQRVRKQCRFWELTAHHARFEVLARYLREAGRSNGWNGPEICSETAERWWNLTHSVRRVVRGLVPSSIDSAAEYPLLAMPWVQPASEERLRMLLSELDTLVRVANDAADRSPACFELVRAYAESGLYWSAVADCVVPLDRPFIVKATRREQLALGRPKGGESDFRVGDRRGWWFEPRLMVMMRDARSNHLTVQITDTNIEFKSRKIRFEVLGKEMEVRLEDARVGSEICTYYITHDKERDISHEKERDRWLRVHLPLKLSRPATAASLVIFLLTFTALVAFFFLAFHWLGAGGKVAPSGSDVAVILVPSAIAASLLVTRESSTIASQITRKSRYLVAVLLGALWVFTLVMYGIDRISR